MAAMNKTIKIILLIATLWPITYMCLFFVYMFATVAGGKKTEREEVNFLIFMAIHMSTILWIFGLMTIYIIDIFKNPCIAGDMKAVWAIILFFGNMISMPVYWYVHVWRKQEPVPAPQSAFVKSYEAAPQSGGESSPVIFCTQCGSRNQPQSRFCMACGYRIELTT